ncbi:MAG: hypothetical protein Q7S83_04135 [bacterium]|nr:hypothetical protein [bacterium]
MHKIAQLMLVAALAFGLAGCAGSFRKPWNFPDPDKATIVDVWSSDETGEDQSGESYVVVFEQRERFVELSVDKATFDSVHEGDTVEIELISITSTEDNRYILEVEYLWHVGGQKYPVIFRWDAKDRPVRPKTDPSRT